MRSQAPLAIAIGGVACLFGLILLGPFVSRGVADDAGMAAFLLSEGAKRLPGRGAAGPKGQAAFAGWGSTDLFAAATAPEPQAPPKKRVARTRKAAPVKALTVLAAYGPMPATPLFKPPADLSPLDDHTLRRGDAVMTSKGVRIFRGSQRYPFIVADFRPLAYAGQVEHRNALLAIDRAVRAPTWTASFANAPATTILRVPTPGPTAIRIVDADHRS